ncbi:Stp1/IreP family PP2C-type Ser/Thr phosphatase [Candidatus Marithrix sp. Canyon 246]|uniref:Stp1/IreP family PP2C-type Ser/Thr phosphatase n=1 Tax=Candidatus Marithrix sp. Canyon 246 TaxID=1827136 RepID=UPI00084A0DFE|nr:Stp1/IreP family PP2C-type Ser/Thr phosphatase [Candidatus Marithrix sp. Canyon 246]
MLLEIVSATDTGLIRNNNEDYIASDADLGFAIVADGMGGYQAGEVASAIAVTTVIAELEMLLTKKANLKRQPNHHYHTTTVWLEQAVIKANQIIYETAMQKQMYQGMGTTVVAVLFHDDFLSIAHVGDSRLYRLRANKFCQITKDHSVLQELIDCGYYSREQARKSPNKHLVTKALGIGEQVSVEIQECSLLHEDIYLLCSDGLSDMLDDDEIHKLIKNAETLDQAVKDLVKAANDKGGNDNISVVLATLLEPQRKSKLAQWLFHSS